VLALLLDALDFLPCGFGRQDDVDMVRPIGSTILDEMSAKKTEMNGFTLLH